MPLSCKQKHKQTQMRIINISEGNPQLGEEKGHCMEKIPEEKDSEKEILLVSGRNMALECYEERGLRRLFHSEFFSLLRR